MLTQAAFFTTVRRTLSTGITMQNQKMAMAGVTFQIGIPRLLTFLTATDDARLIVGEALSCVKHVILALPERIDFGVRIYPVQVLMYATVQHVDLRIC
jgi:hypothetical protein